MNMLLLNMFAAEILLNVTHNIWRRDAQFTQSKNQKKNTGIRIYYKNTAESKHYITEWVQWDSRLNANVCYGTQHTATKLHQFFFFFLFHQVYKDVVYIPTKRRTWHFQKIMLFLFKGVVSQ